jgi:hypothetical protein
MRQLVTSIGVCLALVAATPALGQAYTPDIAEFDGSSSLAFPPDGGLDLAGGGTIEFWVQPDWTEDPGYDPAIVSNIGSLGPSYMVLMLGSRKGIGVAAGDSFEWLDFDFTDGKLHHVSVIDAGQGSISIIVDNKLIGMIPVAFRSLPSSGFFIGSGDGVNHKFKGAIAGLRIWDLPVDPNDLAIFAMRGLIDRDGAPHPYVTALVGVSDFDKRSFSLLEPEPIANDVSDEVALGEIGASANPPTPDNPSPPPAP